MKKNTYQDLLSEDVNINIYHAHDILSMADSDRKLKGLLDNRVIDMNEKRETLAVKRIYIKYTYFRNKMCDFQIGYKKFST